MKSQFRAINRFISKIKATSSIDGTSSSGTFQVDDISVGGFSLPQGAFTYFVTADFAQTGKEEIFRIVNTVGDVLTYDKRISVGGYVKPAHAAGASIRVNDVADILNEMSDNIDNFGDVNQIDGTQTIKVWGGVFNNGGTVYNVTNQILTITVGQLVDNTTNYIHFDIATRLFVVTASSTLAAAVCIASVVVTGGVIGIITDLRPGFAMTYGELTTKLDKSGGLRDGMGNAIGVFESTSLGVEVKRSIISSGFVPSDTQLIQTTDPVTRNKTEVTYSVIKSDVISSVSPSIQETNFESIIATGDIVGQTPDGIYKVQQEVKTSTALGGTNTYLDHCLVSTGKFLVLYASGGNVNAVIATVSSSDTVTYGTPISLGSAATPTGKVALINTDKIIAVFAATASTTITQIVLTISGTTISAGTALNETQSANAIVASICKVRTDCFAYCFGVGTSPSGIKVNTVSGTTISAGTVIGTFAFGFSQNTVACAYLSDNKISFSEGISVNNVTNVKIYAITGGGTTVATTYTGTISVPTGGICYHSRYSDTEVVITNSANTERSIFTIPGAGTTLVKTILTANAGANYQTIPLYTNIYGINTGSTILVYQRDILIGTIASTPAYNTQGISYDNGRIIFFNGTTLIPSIVNLARVFSIGVAFNTSGLFTPGKLVSSKTGIFKGYRYYFQLDGTLSSGLGLTNTVDMTKFFGRGVLTDRIMIET